MSIHNRNVFIAIALIAILVAVDMDLTTEGHSVRFRIFMVPVHVAGICAGLLIVKYLFDPFFKFVDRLLWK